MRIRNLGWLFVLGVLACATSLSQEADGRIFGTAYDPQGAVIPSVEIIATEVATHVARTDRKSVV